jgi:NAD(P)H-hydrate epimerase
VARGELTPGWVAERLPRRPADAHKGTFGKLLVVAGSLEYAGAAVLAGLGAARTGAGLVCLATPESVGARLLGTVPELTGMLLAEEAPGLIGPAGWRRVATEAPGYDAVVVGPGLGRHPATQRRVRGFLADLRMPLLVDADGLNALAADERWWRQLHTRAVVTPHPVEFGRLLGSAAGGTPSDSDEERLGAAERAAATWGTVVVLKGAHTVVASPDGEVLRSPVATPALATAGSGDVLSGAIGALLAAGCPPFDAAACGVAVHGAAGMLAESRIGTAGVLASDVARLLPVAIRQLRGDAA